MSPTCPTSDPTSPDADRIPIEGETPPVDVLVYIYNKDEEDVVLIVSHGRRLLGSDNLLWLLCQPRIVDKLQYTLEEPMPQGSFEMYHHELREWLALPEPLRPIIIAPERALLWRRAGVTKMPRVDSVIRLTAFHADVLPTFPSLPSTPIRGMFSFKSSPTLKGAIGLITPSKPSTSRRRGVRPGRMASTGGRKPKPFAEPGASTTPSRLFFSSSSPPAPSQLLRDVFGDEWKARLPKTATTPTRGAGYKRPRSPSSEVPETSSRRLMHAFESPAAGPSGIPPSVGTATDNVQRRVIKKRRIVPVDPLDIIDISEDADDVIPVPRRTKGKGKGKARTPIPADAEIIELSD